MGSIFCLPILAFSQMQIIKDTTYYQNMGRKIMVVQTTNRQYYNDSACVWEVAYPEISNLENRIRESSINLMFSKEVSFGDCNDKVCDRTTMYFPMLNRYWDNVVITEIKNDLLSYYLHEGSCPTYTKVCFLKTRHHLYNLKAGIELESSSFFRPGEKTQQKLDSIVLGKLDFTPEDMDALRYERQFYLEKGKLMAFYDTYTIGKKDTFSIELPHKDIQSLINPNGPLAVFFNEKKTTSK